MELVLDHLLRGEQLSALACRHAQNAPIAGNGNIHDGSGKEMSETRLQGQRLVFVTTVLLERIYIHYTINQQRTINIQVELSKWNR